MSLSVPDSGGGQKGTPPFKGCPPVPLSPSPSEDVDAKPTTEGFESESLAAELATLAGLDVARMLAGDLTETDWPRIASAAVLLSEQRPDKADELAALVARIDSAYATTSGVKVTP